MVYEQFLEIYRAKKNINDREKVLLKSSFRASQEIFLTKFG